MRNLVVMEKNPVLNIFFSIVFLNISLQMAGGKLEFYNTVLVSKTSLQKELTAGNRAGQIYRLLLNWKLYFCLFFSCSNVGSGAQLFPVR